MKETTHNHIPTGTFGNGEQ